MNTNKPNPSEAVTDKLFRSFYGADTFIEKQAIPKSYAFKSKNKNTKDETGYPDFFLDVCSEYCIVVESKKDNHTLAENEVKHYMKFNKIEKDIIGIAISGQNKNKINVSYFIKIDKKPIEPISIKHLLPLDEINKQYNKIKYKPINNDELLKVLKDLNKQLNTINLRPTDRSLFFAGLMIALKNDNFYNIYEKIQAPSPSKGVSNNKEIIAESKNMNEEVLKAITTELHDKINNKSKSYKWNDQFAFINNLTIPLDDYKKMITKIKTKIFIPFQHNQNQDILGKSYKIFLERAGKAEDKNIILTPYHIVHFMIQLAKLSPDDVVLDTCTGSGGFLMEAMENMINNSHLSTRFSNPSECEEHIRTQQLIGFENDAVLFALACSNMFLHGDGKTNLIFRSSLLGDVNENIINDNDDDLLNEVHKLNPNKCIINPPYENDKPIKFTKQALEYLNPTGRLVIIMPSNTLSQHSDTTKEILKTSKLECVIKMPMNLFSEQDRAVDTSIFIFKKPHAHSLSDETLFYNLEDDGLESVQHKGRIDSHNKWDSIEKYALEVITNFKEIPNISKKTRIFDDNGNFIFDKSLKILDKSKYQQIPISTLFYVNEGTLQSTKNIEGDYPFITAGKSHKTHNSYSLNTEAIIYAAGAAGSLGNTHYIKGKFTASNLCFVLTNRENADYPINLLFYNYYFQSIKKQIVSHLKEGKSKKTISKPDFENYKIDYIPYEKQLDFVEEIQKFQKLQEKYFKAKSKFEETINNLSDII